MTTMKSEWLVCVKCGKDVMGPVPGIGGVPVHTGHVNTALNQACGWWGFRRVTLREMEPCDICLYAGCRHQIEEG